MTDPKTAERAVEWLERELEDLATLRNASRRDPGFKAWRQNTLTVLQRIWPGETRRFDRFRRIPFSPPMTRATDRQVREYYERGWGEAGAYLRELIEEVRREGVPDPLSGSPAGPARLVLAEPEAPEREPGPPARTEPPAAAPRAIAEEPEPAGGAAGEADAFLARSPVFRGLGGARRASPAKAQPPGPAPGTSAWELARTADELERLGVPRERAAEVRDALLDLSRAAATGEPAWECVAEVLRRSGSSPALARRVIPLVLGFLERAA